MNSLNARSAVDRYIAIRHRLPAATSPASSVYAEHLGDLVDQIDVFVLDGFGVLNVGTEVIPGAVERIGELQRRGCRTVVLTNGATLPVENSVKKYQRWGFEFTIDDVVSSRDALIQGLKHKPASMRWGVLAPPISDIATLGVDAVLLEDDPLIYQNVDGFVLLSTVEWPVERLAFLKEALAKRTRPVLVGNPDLVAPFAASFSLEPGLVAHELADDGLCEPEFFGKPFGNAFDIVLQRLGDIDPQRVAMVGDSPHTDILGATAYGWKSVLITDHGLLRDLDVEAAIADSGIRPDFICRTT